MTLVAATTKMIEQHYCPKLFTTLAPPIKSIY